LGRTGSSRGRALRPFLAREHGIRLSRSHLPHPCNAGDRRGDQPLGRLRRSARRQRRRLVPRRGRERHPCARPIGRPAGGHTDRGRRSADGSRPDPSADRAHRRPRALDSPAPTPERSDKVRTVSDPKFEQLKQRLAETQDLTNAATLLFWDQRVMMPPGGAAARAEAIATITRLAQERFVDAEIGRLLEDLGGLEESSDYDSFEASLIRVTRRDYDKATRVPPELVGEMSRTSVLALSAWGP